MNLGQKIQKGLHMRIGSRRATFASCLYYSLSDSSLAITFATFLWQNVRVCHPNLANLFGALLRVCTNIPFVSVPQNVDFAH